MPARFGWVSTVEKKFLEKIKLKQLLEENELMKRSLEAYWTTLAPNVEDYNSSTARLITTGLGKLIKGILWYGDVTTDRLM
ncbi:hypothetical protein QYF36_026096 [Acer negundo]|nr:hypothetical protein QYF36_026096 [Acer negundo]